MEHGCKIEFKDTQTPLLPSMQQPVKVQGQVVDICSCHVLRGIVRGEEGQAREDD